MFAPESQTENAKIANAALRLAAVKGWPKVTLEAVAKNTKIPLSKLKKRFPALREILPVIADENTRKTLAAVDKTSATPHDILFALMMSRFDVLQMNRKAVLSIAKAAQSDPDLLRFVVSAISEGLYTMALVAELDMLPKPLIAPALLGVYARVFWTWQKDETPDMSKTMAALDQALRLVERAINLVKRNSLRATTSAHKPVSRPRPIKRARTRKPLSRSSKRRR
jgi:ubiquinone biosynthesis protein COQ9